MAAGASAEVSLKSLFQLKRQNALPAQRLWWNNRGSYIQIVVVVAQLATLVEGLLGCL